MADFGSTARQLANDPMLRWLGPHKGVVHLALASITNACFDLWAKSRGVPLWRLLLDLEPGELVALLDLSYLDELLDENAAMELLRRQMNARPERGSAILREGYPGYDTSVGWMAYDDSKVRELTRQAIDKGFHAFKLKVGSADRSRDLRRAAMLRECAGEHGTIMFDANQQWALPAAREMCRELSKLNPLWIEEPTHPDDIMAHAALAREIAPVKIACGEHIPNRVVFKNFFEARADALCAGRLHAAGWSERISHGEPAGEEVRFARRAARRRYGADPSASGLVPAHRARERAALPGAHSTPAIAFCLSGGTGRRPLSHPAGAGRHRPT